jgi:hypothetical protein
VTTLQTVMFGMMLIWTPGALLFAFFLWKEKIGPGKSQTPGGDLTRIPAVDRTRVFFNRFLHWG